MTLRPRRLIMWTCVVWVLTMAGLVFGGSVWANYERQERMMSATERRRVPLPTIPHPPISEPVKPGKFHREITVASHLCGIKAEFIRAHALRESSLNPKAVSKSNAVGLMQLKVGAARDMGLEPEERFDAQKNLIAGSCYYRMLLDKFNGDRHRALVAYHRGASGGTSAKSRAYADDVIQGSAQ